MTEQKRLVDRLYFHWSFGILCIYCFVGLLASMFIGLRAFSATAEPNDFNIAIILGLTSVIAGVYTKIVDDSSSSYSINRYVDSLPDNRKEMGRRMFK